MVSLRATGLLVVGTVLGALLVIVAMPTAASAAGTLLFQNSFTNSTVNGTGSVSVPTPTSGTNGACLTAFGNFFTGPLRSCSGTSDLPGSGKLRLTNNNANQIGGVFGTTSVPTSSGLDVTFNAFQWGSSGGADGLAFLLAAVDPANPKTPTAIGPAGGSLAYSPSGSVAGLPRAYLGVGFDVFGNFSSTDAQGSGCATTPNITAAAPGAVVVRGPGNGLAGYCGLATTWNGTAASKVTLRSTTRTASRVPVQVLINPTTAAFTSDSGVQVAGGNYKVVITPVGQAARTVSGPLPSVVGGLYPSTAWLNPNGVPKQLAFGFVGSTGSVTDNHEISDVRVLTFNPVPQLGVATTSYSMAAPAPGDPVNYSVVPSVLAGAPVASAITVTQTVPVGVVPAGAYGSGWECDDPVGRTITCTTTATSFAAPATLPPITVVGIVTGAGMTSALIQNGSATQVSSTDAASVTDLVTTAVTPPAAPTGVSVAPAIGPLAGGGSVSGSATSSVAPTALMIGTVAEQQAGTPVVLLPCASGQVTGCFTISGSTVNIPSMPARTSAASVRVTFVTRGVAGSAAYVYADEPATPAAPTATAGLTSVAVAWAAPADNGSPITGYVVTPYLGGVAQSQVAFGPGTTSTTFTGLSPGTSWAYTVAAVNAFGTSTPSAKSTTAVPYTLPSAPTITAVSARNSAALLTWTAPNNGGSAITSYVVTPWIGLVAQPTQTFGAGTTQTVTGLTPGAAYTFTVAAQNVAGTGPASARSTAVTPNSSPSLSFPAPPAGEVGVPYSHQLTVTNGTAPFVWSVSSGTLPAGLSLNASTGLISGTPTSAGSTTFTVRVVDAAGDSATRSATLVIAAAPVVTFAPVAGEVGVAYSQQPTLAGGTAPYTWAVSAGSLPAGLTINASTGLVSGTPTNSGSFTLTVTATDAFGQTAGKTVNLVVAARPAFVAGTPQSAQVGVAYTTTLAITGGTAPFTWSIAAGSLPAGLALNSGDGTVSGTPTAQGSYAFTITVVDGFAQTATKAVTIVVGAGPVVITKTANVSSTTAGSTVGYTITIANTGSTTRSGVTLDDPLTGVLDDAAYNANATATTGTVSYASATLSWTGTIAAGGTATITYSVTVAAAGTGNKTLTNTATSSTLGTNCAGGSSDARCSSSVIVAGLTMTKSANVTSTTPGSTVRYQVVVTNTGPVATTGVGLTDELAGVLDDATYADAAATSGSVAFSGSALNWTGTLAAGASATITYSVVVRDPDPGNKSLSSTVVSASPGSSCPSTNPAPSCSVTVPVLVPALVITNAASGSTTTPGATVSYTVIVSNTGQTAYTGAAVSVALTDALDDATYDGHASSSAGAVSYAGGTLGWTGNLAIGAVVTITYSLTVKQPDSGDKTMSTVATSPASGSTCSPGSTGSACVSTVQVLVPGLTISTSAGASSTTPGSVVTYSVVATNTGQTSYPSATFATSLAGVLDDATYNGNAAATTGAIGFNSPTITWTGALAVGASVTLTYSVTVRTPDAGNRSLVTVVSTTTPGSNCAASSSDPRCSSTVAVQLPGLTFTNSADAVTATPGQVVRYTLTVTNSGETTQQDIVVVLDTRGVFDDATYNNDALVSTGSRATNSDGTSSWTLTLAPGASATTTVSVTVNDPDTGDRVLSTLASSQAPGSTCPAGSPNPSCRTAVNVLVPGLTITKSADAATATPGDPVGYTVTVVNNGETAYPAATFSDDLTDVLTDAAYAGGATASSGTVSYASSVLSWTGALGPGASATIGYSVAVSDPGTGDKTMTNKVVSTSPGSNCAAGSTDPRCVTAVHVDVPGLTIAKTANRTTTAPGQTVDYTVTVTNSGATAYTGATFADSLVGVLDDASFVVGSVTATSGTASQSGATLTWTGNLAIGATATITYAVDVHSADGGNNLLTNSVVSDSRGSNCKAGSSDTRCRTTVAVARLRLHQAAGSATTTPGSAVVVTQTFTNTGQVPYVGISVLSPRADTSDDTIPLGDQVVSSGILVRTPTDVTWTGDIPVGVTVTSTRTLTVKDPDPGNKIITAKLFSTAAGNNCSAASVDPLCTFSTAVLIPGLTISKTASAPATVPGGTVGYTITVHNSGTAPYSDAVVSDTLVGVLDDATFNSDAVASIGSVDYTSPTLTWTGDLAVGATSTITYSVIARSPDSGDKTMANPVSSSAVGSTCPPGGGAAACHTTVAVLTPALTILKTADRATVTLDSTVTYTVKVTNSGQTSYPAAAFSESLAGVLDDAAYNAGATTSTSGTVSYTSGVLSWSGALAPGGSATITYTVTVSNPDTGDHELANTVTSSNTGSNCPSGSTDPRCTATVVVTDSVSLTFTKTADVAATRAGAVVTYTVTAVNSSGEAIDANLTDPLDAILDDATWNDDLVASGGTADFTEPDLTWSGSVAASGTVTVTYSVTVRSGVTGNQVLDGRVTSTLPAASNNCLAASIDPRCASSVPVAGLLLQQAYTETSTTPGSLVHLSATFTNTGQLPYVGITISSASAGTVDDAVPTGDQTATSGNLVLSGTAITWTGDIPVGGTVSVQGTLTVKDPDPGDRLISGALVSSALGNNCPSGGTDVRCTTSLPVLLPGLALEKMASATTAEPGDIVDYTITVANTGQTAYPTATVTDSLAGVLDDATFGGDASASIGTVGYASETLTWSGALAVGQEAVITYSVAVMSPATGDKTMVNSVASPEIGSTCPPSSGSAACTSLVAVLTPGLTIDSSASKITTVPGETVTYTVSASNTGQTELPDATFDVPLAGVLDDATFGGGATVDRGTANFAGSTLTWSGALVPGDTVTMTYEVVVEAAPTGDFALSQTVVSTTAGNNCSASSADPRCPTVVPIASLRILNTSDVATTQPTGVVRNTVTVTNNGQVPYVDLVVNDSFVGSLDDATYNGDAAATSGTLLLVTGTGQVRWTGDLAPGETVTVTGSLTVSNPPAGNKNLSTLVTTNAVASNCPPTGGAAACATSVPVLLPQLTITKTAGTSSTAPGETVAYTITATNTGETAYTDATITDQLGGVLNGADYNGDASADTGTVGYTAPVLTWTGDLAVGAHVTILYTVEVHSPYLGDGTVLNQVISDELGSTCPTIDPATGCSSAVPVLVPVLDIAVTADRSTTVPGGTVGYTVTVHNTGQSDYDDATVTTLLAGVLDDGSYAGDGTADVGAVSYAAPSLTWTGYLPVGATATITYSVDVAEPDLGDLDLATSVSSSAPGSTCGSAPHCLSNVAVLIPGLAVSIAADVATATPGDQASFTITVSNTGQTAYVSTVVSSDLTAVLDDAELDGAVSASTGVASFSAPAVSWAGSLEPGDSATIHFTVTVATPDAGDRTMSATVVAEDQGSTCLTASSNGACTATVQVLIPRLSIIKSADAPTTTPGSVVIYSIAISNTGQTAYTGASIDDSLSGVLTDSTYNGDAVVDGGGVLSYTDSTLSWTGALPIGASATITYSITVDDPDPGDKHMTNTVTSTTPGSTCPPAAPGTACTAVVHVLVPALVVTKTASAVTVVAGQAVGFTITVTNTGEAAYVPAIVTDSLSNVLDDATYAGDADPSAGSVGYANGVLTWTLPLAVGATATVTYSVTADFPAHGDRTMTNSALSTSPGSSCRTAEAPDCTAAVDVVIPALTVSKTAGTTEIAAGGTVHYTISATNTGEADYPMANLSDSFADLLDDATYNGDAVADTGALSYAIDTLSWTGTLARDMTVTITYSMTTVVEGLGDSILTNRVVSTSTGSTCAADSVDPGCVTSTPIAARTIELSGLTPSFTLTGAPHTTVEAEGAVTMTVTTNSPGGYEVTVLADADELTGSPGNDNTIPLSMLSVRGHNAAHESWFSLSDMFPTVVYSQNTASAPDGDAVSNDFQVEIPNVLPDTYSTSLNYLVSAQ